MRATTCAATAVAFVFAGLLGAAAPRTALADTNYCSGGQVYEGRIVAERPDRIVIALKKGELSISPAEVERIVRDDGTVAAAYARDLDASATPERSAGADAAVALLDAAGRDATASVESRVAAIGALEATGGRKALLGLATLLGEADRAVQSAARDAFVAAARAPLPPEVRAVLERQAKAPAPLTRLAAACCLGAGEGRRAASLTGGRRGACPRRRGVKISRVEAAGPVRACRGQDRCRGPTRGAGRSPRSSAASASVSGVTTASW